MFVVTHFTIKTLNKFQSSKIRWVVTILKSSSKRCMKASLRLVSAYLTEPPSSHSFQNNQFWNNIYLKTFFKKAHAEPYMHIAQSLGQVHILLKFVVYKVHHRFLQW